MTIWHKSTIEEFSKQLYRRELLFDDLSDETCIDDNKTSEDFWNYKVSNFKCLYPSKKVDKLPVVLYNPSDDPDKFQKIHINNKVHYKLLHFKSRPIKPQKSLSPSEFFKQFYTVPHTNQLHIDLYKGMCISGLFNHGESFDTRINLRVASGSEFGKNSVIAALKFLTQRCKLITPASFPALLRDLQVTNVLNITEPKAFERFDTFLEAVGDRDSLFENPKLESKTHGTSNTINLSKLSVLITYNGLDYYKEKDQEKDFFDNMFRHHILVRFMPFLFTGNISRVKREPLTTDSYNSIMDWLRNFYYYKENWTKYIHNYYFDIHPLKLTIRYEETFLNLIRFFDFVSDNEKQFRIYVDELVKCYLNYDKMVSNGNVPFKNLEKHVSYDNGHPLTVAEESVVDSVPLGTNNSVITFTTDLNSFKEELLRQCETLQCVSDLIRKNNWVDDEADRLIKMLLINGDLFEPRSGFIQVLK